MGQDGHPAPFRPIAVKWCGLNRAKPMFCRHGIPRAGPPCFQAVSHEGATPAGAAIGAVFGAAIGAVFGAIIDSRLPGRASVLNMIDYYNLLEIPPEASREQVKKAFRRLAKQVHPDANPGSTAEEREVLRRRFIQLAQAYDVLSDPAGRERYRRQWRAHRRRPPGDSGRSARPAGAGPFRSSSAAFGGARRAQDGESRQRNRPNEEPGFEFPGDLLDDVKKLLAEFGLDLQHPLEKLLDRLTAWAREIFQGVAGGMEQGAANDPSPKQPRGGKTAGQQKTGARKAGNAAKQKNQGAEPELDAEMAALKKRARKGKARKASGEQETEEELRRLKASAASRKSRRE